MKIFVKQAFLLILPFTFLLESCWIYSFSGTSIPPAMKTVAITQFENNAPLVVPYLSNQLTEDFKNRIRNQSRLSVVRDNADGTFEGRITGYSIQPVAVTGNEIAANSRLTITVSVKYTSALEPETSFEQSFSRFTDFNPQSGSFSALEQQAINIVVTMLSEDIFNKAFAQW